MAKKKSKKIPLALVITFLVIIVLAVIVCAYLYKTENPKFMEFYSQIFGSNSNEDNATVEAKGELSFHFMMLGNDNAGDSIYVKAGENDILIDAGSKRDSIDDIKAYVDKYVTDNTLEYVIVTHAHEDHYAGFTQSEGSIFDLYECETIIDFPKTNQKELTDKGNKTQYGYYLEERQAEIKAGAAHYNALDCYNNVNGGQRFYNLTDDGNIKLEILYNYYYENKASSENDYSVCVQFHHGDRKFIFTGDLEAEGEEYLIERNNLSQVAMYKAGHHGSNTSSCEAFLEVIKPQLVVVPCVAGSVEYTDILANTFPTQGFINKIAKYTDKVYAQLTIELEQVQCADTPSDTSDDEYENKGEPILLNGNIQVISDASKGVYVDCSNNNDLLKDTDWFKEYRTYPTYWQVA